MRVKSNSLLFLFIMLGLSSFGQYVFEYDFSNSLKKIHEVKIAFLVSTDNDTIPKQTIEYFYSKSNQPDSALCVNFKNKDSITIIYTYEGTEILTKDYFKHDTLIRKIYFFQKGKKTVQKHYGFNENNEFKIFKTQIQTTKPNVVRIKERYHWSKKSLKYYFLGFSNRKWKYYKDDSGFNFYEKINSHDYGKGELFSIKGPNGKVLSFSKRINAKEMIEAHEEFYDEFNNKTESQLIVNGQNISTVIWLIEYENSP